MLKYNSCFKCTYKLALTTLNVVPKCLHYILTGEGPGQLRYPESIALYKPQYANMNEGILVADEGNSRLSLFSCDGTFVNHLLTAKDDKKLKSPQCLAISTTTRDKMIMTNTNSFSINVFKMYQYNDMAETNI